MKRPTSDSQIPTPSFRARLQRHPLRSALLFATIFAATGATILAVSPAARAFAGQPGMHHDPFFAAMHGSHGPDGMHAHVDQVLTGAGVDEARKQQVHAILQEAMTAEHADMRRFHDNGRHLKDALVADPFDNAAVSRLRAEQDRLMLATSRRLADTMVAVARILTPEQRAKLGARIDRMMAAHMEDHAGM